jgi:galactokinase
LGDARIDSLRRRLGSPDAFARAPGRVNLIGDHTDYQDGFCLPVAIDRDVLVAFRTRRDGRAVVDSADPPDPTTVGPLVDAVLDALARRGRAPVGFDAAVASTVPIGSGLSSSAAFEIAIALAALHVAGLALDGRELARAAQEAEHAATGVPCGLMDQLASVFGKADHALLLDCRALRVDPIPLPQSIAIVVVHSGLPRRLATSAYAARRTACEAAATRVGVTSLRDATYAQVADDPIARHVVTENERVLRFVDALRADDPGACGRLMQESHASLRDDFGVSTPELDRLVELATDRGAFGARLTGAGFGGCVVALVAPREAEAHATAIADRYRAETGYEPTAFVARAVEGAGIFAAV